MTLYLKRKILPQQRAVVEKRLQSRFQVVYPWLSGSKLPKKFKDSENQEENCLSCVLDEYEINRKNYYQRSFLVQKKSVTDNFCRHHFKS